MKASEFTERLAAIRDEAADKAIALMGQARDENANGVAGDAPLDFADSRPWQDEADGFALLTGWLYDRVNGGDRLNKRTSMTVKLRKVLGYTYP